MSVFGCRLDCFNKISGEEQVKLFNRFSDINSNEEQGIFLPGLIEPHEIKRKRPCNESAESKQMSFVYKYFAAMNCQRMQV